MDEREPVAFPDSFSGLTVEALVDLQARALQEFDALAADTDIDDAGVQRLETLATGLESLTTALDQARRVAAQVAVKKKRQVAVQPAMASGAGDAADEPPAAPAKPSLERATAAAPQQPERQGQALAITASSPTAGMAIGAQFRDVDDLVAAFNGHAKGLVTSHGNPGFLTVASIANEFEHVIHGERTSPGEFDRMIQDLRNRSAVEDLVAGGGWCAPSEIRYDFFNIACEDGTVDLPTFGVQRGGIRYPVSPSLADVFTGSFTNSTNPWLWQEIDDIATVTGAPNKPCVRVTCPSFDERRLECYGICLTAGNLTDSAYPEATRNHLSLLMSAHYHAMNLRFLQTMESLSTAVVTGAAGTGASILADAPASVNIAANDYRAKYGMCDDDVLEVIFPRWVKDAMRDDHLRRTGFWESPLTDAEITALFRTRRIRVQWVADWQYRGTGQLGQTAATVDWPATVDFMIYAAGTFVKGNGMTLDLGVVRDSVLNAENDHTAGWSEECHLIARYGHESRRYRIPVCAAGRTGVANIACADV